MYYAHLNKGDIYSELFDSLRDFKISEWEWQVKHKPEDRSMTEDTITGASKFVKLHISRMSESM